MGMAETLLGVADAVERNISSCEMCERPPIDTVERESDQYQSVSYTINLAKKIDKIDKIMQIEKILFSTEILDDCLIGQNVSS